MDILGKPGKSLSQKEISVLIRCCQKGFQDVNSVLGISMHFIKSSLKISATIPTGTVVATVGFTRDVRGGISAIFDKAAFNTYISTMGQGMIPTDVNNDMAASCIGELLNMVGGHFASDLAGENISIDITPPSVFAGENIKSMPQSGQRHVILPYSLEEGSGKENISIVLSFPF